MPKPTSRGRTLGAAVLALAIFTLAVLAGPHALEHLLGVDRDADRCAICAAVHGVRSGIIAVPVALVATLLAAGPLTAPRTPILPVVAVPSSASRAPPTVQ